MKLLYLECGMGAAGDMLMSALLELLPDPKVFVEKLNDLKLPNTHVYMNKAKKCGIVGTQIDVEIKGIHEHSHDIAIKHEHHHSHSHNEPTDIEHHHHHTHEHTHQDMNAITHIIMALDIPEKVKQDALNVYQLIAQAEAKAHDCPVQEIHFHEVGTLDAIVDIVGVCWLIHEINADKIMASPVHVGSGYVKCAHGILPVPAPATAYLLQGIPSYSGTIEAELCTPTGAALLKYFATEFGKQPVMSTQKIGYGMGSKNFEVANCVRAFLGTNNLQKQQETVVELSCNIDDMTGEQLAFVQQMLLENDALDVYMISIQMKKGRPGVMLCCLCTQQQAEKLSSLLLRHTSTFGVRQNILKRTVLKPFFTTLQTSYGIIAIKQVEQDGIVKWKAEYEDVAKAAKAANCTLKQVYDEITFLMSK